MGRGKILRELALKIYGPEKAMEVWKRIEFVGDLAIIRCPLKMTPEELKPLAESILSKFPMVKSVWAGLPGVEGPYRLRRHVHLAGEVRSETIYREHGCVFKVDINKAYVSPALNYEHKRIAKLVRQGETVVNMFAGIGLFSIIIAKYSKPDKVHSIDINPYAFEYMVENIRLNKVENIVIPYLGDAKEIIEKHLLNTADRVLMPYPELALEYFETAVKALKQRAGWIHVYLHVKSLKGKNPLKEAEEAVVKTASSVGVGKYVIENSRIVRNVGPRLVQVVVDLYVE
ncbi:class I SAM-dependent methyltransferase family protein [Thermosphaera chiliense]|uniref:Class I SAM-dependent methyltransferase family protein n=1 Tax=Thermosphaera chiliense TaxID=3402707 RepID=A0A7M1UNP4_9CREN|nr:class I SAM-dependent methyltransferase family protein [Thermosphaera aggregans]QOR93885.1 class I SAM-dependent methyltransferase family protein [Thermosphaera aggregans]